MTGNAGFVDAFLLALRPGQLRWLQGVVARGGGLSDAELSACPAVRPLLVANPDGGWRLPKAQGARIADRAGTILADHGVTARIVEAATQGHTDAALSMLRDHGGVFISMTEGVAAAERIAGAFPEAMADSHLTLGLLQVVNALKSGALARADVLMERIADRITVPALDACGASDDPELICVLFMMAVYADDPVPDGALDRLFATLRDLPGDASLLRGVLYNVGLDIMMRRGECATADEAAQRALFHYNAAGETGLGFYVQLYLVIIALWLGDVDRAGQAVEAARVALSSFEGQSENDAGLLHSLSLIQGYEAGQAEAFVQHLTDDEDNIPVGELWPAMAEPILSYGRRALARHATPSAALAWVQRWRLRQWRSQRFAELISVQEVLALQDMGRWQEADEVLSMIGGAEGGELQLARLAAALDRAPGSEELARTLKQAAEAPEHSARQRLVLTLMATESATHRGNEREAARLLSGAVARQASPQVARVFSEQGARLARILANRPLRAELRRLPQLTRVLQQWRDTTTVAQPRELTRQEYRILLLLAEGQPNKMIAQRMGISLPTVKFHVGNLLAKAGVKNRRDLVRHALRVGWVSDA